MFGRKPKTNDAPATSGDDTWTNSDASYDQTPNSYDTDVIPDHTGEDTTEVTPPPRVSARGRQPLLLGLGITALLVMAGAGAYLALSPSRSSETPGAEAGVIVEPAPEPTTDTGQPSTEEAPTQITAQPTPQEEAIGTPTPDPAGEEPTQTDTGLSGTQTPITQAPGQESPKEGGTLASSPSPEKRTTTVSGDPFRLLVNTNGEQLSPQVTGSDTTPASLRGGVQPISVTSMNAPLITAPPISVQAPIGQTPAPVTVNQISATPAPVTQGISVKPVQISPAQTKQEPLPGPRAEVIMVPPVAQSGASGVAVDSPAQQNGNTTTAPVQEIPAPVTPKPPTAKEIAQASLASYVNSQTVQYVGYIAGETPQAVLNISGQELVLGVGDPIPGTRVTLRRADGQKASLTMDSVSTELPITQTGGTQ